MSGFVSGHEQGMIAFTVLGAVASLQIGYFVGGVLQVRTSAQIPARTTVCNQPPKVGVVPVDVELGGQALPTLSRDSAKRGDAMTIMLAEEY